MNQLEQTTKYLCTFFFNYCVFRFITRNQERENMLFSMYSYFDLLLECDLLLHCGAINKDTNGTNGFDNTALFTVVSDDDVFPETDCQLRAPDYLGIVAVRLNISHNDGLCLHPVLANINQNTNTISHFIALWEK